MGSPRRIIGEIQMKHWPTWAISYRWCPRQLPSFHPSESDSDLLRVPVRNAMLQVIGLFSPAIEKAPLCCGIASFSRRSESYSGGHYVFSWSP